MPFTWQCRKCLSILELSDHPDDRVSCPDCGSFAMTCLEKEDLSVQRKLDRIIHGIALLNQKLEDAMQSDEDEGPGLKDTQH